MCNRALGALAALLLAACQQAVPAQPALWQVDGPNGERAWLFGTIHALPEPLQLSSPAMTRAVQEADSLVMEVAALEDEKRTALAFHQLSAISAAPPLAERADPADRANLVALMGELGLPPDRFNQLDTWAAALVLAQQLSARTDAKAANGADRAILVLMRGKPVREFEGAERQLAIFDTLPEAEQRDLLGVVVTSAKTAANETRALQQAWRSGDAARLEALDHQGMLADPELRAALLVDRNNAWLARLTVMLARGEKPLVAVGALHVVGRDGLLAALEAKGYKVTRLQ